MASAANSSAAATASSNYQSSGAGGKFRKNPFKRSQSTPYDRPPTSLRPAAQLVGNSTRGWFSKIVDPASRLITAGAHRLFSSVFQKRLLAPPSPNQEVEQRRASDEVNEMVDVRPDATTNVFASVTNNTVVPGDSDTSGAPDCYGVAELENIFKQKSFTRSEIDRLTELLASRAAENSVGAEQQGRSKPNYSDIVSGPGRHENVPNPPVYENRSVFAAISTPEGRTKVLKDDVASPAEIAKAYMGSRPTNVSHLDLGFQYHRSKEEVSASRNPLSTPKSSPLSLVQKPVSQIGNSTNGFMTPRYRGRSAIYNMARAPYSRVNSPAFLKAAETDVNDGCRSSPYLKSTENNQSKRQVLKRRSTVLENDIGPVGPIRRIRQKPNLLHPKTLSLPPINRQETHVSGAMPDIAEMPSSMEWISQNHSLSKVKENNMPGSCGGYVPLQSIESAQKIFQHLDKFAPTGKSPEKKTGVSVESSLSKSTLHTLNGSAHKSSGNVNSLKTVGSTQGDKKDDSELNSYVTNNHPPKMSLFVNDVSAQNSLISSSNVALQNGSDHRYTDSIPSGKDKTAHHLPLSAFDRPQKNRGFQMSAFEDFLDVDDDVPSAVAVTSTLLTEGVNERERAELSKKSAVTPNGLSPDKSLALEKPAGQDLEPPTSSLSVKEQESLVNGSAAAESTDSLYSAVTSSSTSKLMPETVSIFDSIPKSDKVGSCSDKSTPSPSYIPPTSVEASLKDSKLQAPNSAHDTAAEANEPDRIDIKSSTLKPGGIPVTSSVQVTCSSDFQTNNATPINGLHSSLPGPSGAPSLFVFPSNLHNQGSALESVSYGNAEPTSDSCTGAAGICLPSAAINSKSALSGSGSHPNSSVTVALPFKSGIQPGSSAVSTLATPTTLFTVKSGDTALSTAAASLASVKPSSPPMNGNNIFGLSASTLKSPTSEAQTSASPVSSGSQFSFLAPSASSVSAPNLTSTFAFTGSSSASVSTPVFGTSPAPTFSSSSPIFGSSPASPSFSGSTVSALGSSTSLSVSTSITSPNIFGGSWQSSKPVTSAPSFTAASPPTAFSFGSTLSGSSASTTTNTAAATFAFGLTPSGSSATTTHYVFGGSSSAASGNGPQFVFGSSSGAAAPSVFSVASSAVSTPAMSAPLFQSQPVFGNPSPSSFGPASSLSGNNYQVTMEDSMAEDSMQPSTPAVQTLGAPVPAPTPTGNLFLFTGQQNQFGGGPPSTGNAFGFNSQPNPFALQNAQFQPSGSGEFTPGNNGSFSIGTGSVDKSQRKTFKAKRNRPLTRK